MPRRGSSFGASRRRRGSRDGVGRRYTHRVGRAGRDGSDAEALSLFTRNMAPLAPSLVALLEDAGQDVDAQLRECADERERRLAGRAAAAVGEDPAAAAPAPAPAAAAPADDAGDLFLAALRAVEGV